MNIFEFIFIHCLILNFTQLQAAKWSCAYNNIDLAPTRLFQQELTSAYSCELKSSCVKATDVTEIKGRHETRMSDADVIYLDIVNDLKTFSSIFCQKFENLEIIDLEEVFVGSIDENSLENCKSLKMIILDSNNLRNVSEKLLTKNSNLIKLRISYNKLSSLPDKFFQNQHLLEIVELPINEINFLPSGIFHPLVKLQNLSLQNNELYALNPEWFLNLKNLRMLNLEMNLISEVPSESFKFLKNLQELFLGQNLIENLPSSCFEGLQELIYLDLQENIIMELPIGVFEPLKNLENLLLNNNKLRVVNADSFGIHKNLKIDLRNNKINRLDKNIIKQVSNVSIYIANNVCYKNSVQNKIEIEKKLQKCFENYQRRSEPLPNTSKVAIPSTLSNVCGTLMINEKILIGGTPRGSYPWNAALQKINGKFFCGGTLISNRNVVTAAHCIQDKYKLSPILARDIYVLLGVHDLNIPHEQGREIFAVSNIYMHSQWNPFTENYDADIAVLVLEGEVTFGRFIQPICFIQPGANLASIIKGIVVGFGRSEDDVKVLDMTIHSNKYCFLRNYILARFSSNRTFCGGTGTGTGVCDGDSGSGLYIKYENSYYLRGIVSESLYIRDCNSNYDVNNYSIFTDVLKFTDWINAVNPIEEVYDEVFEGRMII